MVPGQGGVGLGGPGPGGEVDDGGAGRGGVLGPGGPGGLCQAGVVGGVQPQGDGFIGLQRTGPPFRCCGLFAGSGGGRFKGASLQ